MEYIDDDKFITRWIVDHGWKINIQYSKDSCIEITLGEYQIPLLTQ